MQNYVIVAVGGELLVSTPYIAKLDSVLKELGNTSLISWEREESKKNKPHFINYKTSGRFSLLTGYILWIIKLFIYFRFKAKADKSIYFVSRLDAALPAYLANRLGASVKYIYLDRDAYFMTYRLGPFKSLIRSVEFEVGKKALRHWVPGKSRNFTKLNNVDVFPNSPDSKSIYSAQKIADTIVRSSKFTIYLNGWLTQTRGASMILESIKRLDETKFRVLVAGNPSCDNVNQLIRLPLVQYLGELPVAHSLAYYAISDVVLAFYDPKIEINRNAEPNKWYDAMVMGTTIITNYGIETASMFDTSNFEFVEYGDDIALETLLEKLEVEGVKAGRKASMPAWDEVVKDIVSRLPA